MAPSRPLGKNEPPSGVVATATRTMRILCCLNRDLASNIALNLLLPSLDGHDVRVGLSDRVGSVNSPTAEAPDRRELRVAEQSLPNEVLFPLIERAGLPDTGSRYLTFAEIERYRGVRVAPLPNPNTPAGLEAVRAFAPDLILTIRYGAILQAPVISIPRLGVLNLHSGLLPDYRGVLATFRALLAGDSEIGCTLHYIADGTIDTGPIVDVARMAVAPAQSLLWHILALYPLGIRLISTALSKLNRGETLATTAQVATEGGYYTYPTIDEWADFKRRGWATLRASDLHDVFRRYGPFEARVK
ncbi:MAG: formyl transferase [Gammaproteobacteria bacterium]|nr:MAG: formyl transferase [Gammaproteobacteria bacterium]